MMYRKFQNIELSLLGFGTMRLPTHADGSIDMDCLRAMTKYAIDHGVNYYDTAYPYHGGESERAIGEVLREYPRESWYLASKYPGHQIISTGYNPAEIFEEQLRKCGVEYFDFYLLHNVYENSMDTYLDPRWGIIDYFKEQKRLGRIRHLGFSSHAEKETLRKFLDLCGEDMEFCQIELNYLDWTLQDARGKYELLTERGIPVWVMEPVRGGKLAHLSESSEAKLKVLRGEDSIASWGFRFLQGLPNVGMVLSGMSDMAQMEDNVKTFSEDKPLNEEENALLMEIAESLKNNVSCTGCRYCCDGCPQELDIPGLISVYNELRYLQDVNVSMRVEFLPEEKKPSACVGCGQCAKMCPQKIDVPTVMEEFSALLETMPKWADISKQREEAAKKLKGNA